MASIEKRINSIGAVSYRVKVRLRGYQSQSATFVKLTDAKRWAAATETAIREGRYFKSSEAKKHTLAELLHRYERDVLVRKSEKLRKNQTGQLAWFKQEIGALNLADLNRATLVECRDKLLQTKSPATVVRYMAALSHALTIAVNEWEWLDDTPMRKVKKPKEARGRVRFLSDDERARLLLACQQSNNPQLYLCVVLALSTGMRLSELMNLTWQDVNLKDGFIILQHTKNNERRRVPLAGLGLELLRDYAKVRLLHTALLFPSSIKPMQAINLRKPFQNALKQAQIEDFRWHDLRHCTASYLAMNGASLAEIAEVLGHKTLSMVKRYAHLSDGHISRVVAAMNEKIF